MQPLVDENPKQDTKHDLKDSVWLFMETNKAFNLTLLSMIAMSTVALCCETVREFEKYDAFFTMIEVFFVVIFTAEYVARLWSTPQPKFQFLMEFMNVVDLLAILPFYIEFVYHFITSIKGEIDLDSDSNTAVLRSLRLARLFKFGRYSPQLSLVTGAFLRSGASFLMLGFMLSIALIIFSTLMYLAEQGDWNQDLNCYVRSHYNVPGGFTEDSCGPYQSIPQTFWWAITTMTTVGYGDTFPITVTGKLIAGIAMVVGILSVALPTTVLGVQFGDSYAAIEEERKRLDIQRRIPGNMKQTELKKQVAEFLAVKQQITELRSKLDTAALKLCTGPGSETFKKQLKSFGDSVENSTDDIMDILNASMK